MNRSAITRTLKKPVYKVETVKIRTCIRYFGASVKATNRLLTLCPHLIKEVNDHPVSTGVIYGQKDGPLPVTGI